MGKFHTVERRWEERNGKFVVSGGKKLKTIFFFILCKKVGERVPELIKYIVLCLRVDFVAHFETCT